MNEQPDNTTFTGTIIRMVRPSPDITYDYILKLDKPYRDDNNASGMTLNVDQLVLLPGGAKVWETLENNIDKKVTLTGWFEWGYAETKHFVVFSIK